MIINIRTLLQCMNIFYYYICLLIEHHNLFATYFNVKISIPVLHKTLDINPIPLKITHILTYCINCFPVYWTSLNPKGSNRPLLYDGSINKCMDYFNIWVEKKNSNRPQIKHLCLPLQNLELFTNQPENLKKN